MERVAPARPPVAASQRPDEESDLQCPRCGRSKARVIGRSDVLPIIYLRCDACQQTSVTGVRT